jgi:flagellar hook-basal body complex protein FliE
MSIDRISPSLAANAYSNMQKVATDSTETGDAGDTGSAGGTGSGGGASFGDMIKKAASDSIDTMKAGEKASASAITGKADLTDVVQAVTNSELTLQTVVAVRDRMLSAYQSIMQMSM